MNYQEQCTKYFAPLDEIAEAMLNCEGIAGLSFNELYSIIGINKELQEDLCKYCG
ncbi:MAG: hypothetical protein HOK52_14740 [Candidatus Marinimicrobia bacterium]|jgi:hypothetical protein|nr:hypothetical protein [Candidatus Neomarinimicrobiota bacterium]